MVDAPWQTKSAPTITRKSERRCGQSLFCDIESLHRG